MAFDALRLQGAMNFVGTVADGIAGMNGWQKLRDSHVKNLNLPRRHGEHGEKQI